MEATIKNWQELSLTDFKSLATDFNTVHHAVQFIAYASIHFIKAEKDDSHTAMYWNPVLKAYEGNLMHNESGSWSIFLAHDPFEIGIRDAQKNVIKKADLIGKTKNDMLMWLTLNLHELGFDTSEFSTKTHYEIPAHPIDPNGTFSVTSRKSMLELNKYRDNSHLVLEHLSGQFKSAHPVRIWPHHFDEGCYVPIQQFGGKDSRSLSLGMAVPDSYFNQPYFYVTTWAKDGIDYSELPEIAAPGAWYNKEWTGQVLEAGKLIDLGGEAQAQAVHAFFNEAIKNARRLVGWAYKY